ncbi:telomere repeat-binding protein 2-like isoform X1 [Iris pallida]|uniref:Telomere repeat-binding protein 2-like isoform X1 n=1 Tax=Iris pallida TaxID=29817 RepID=A0AAX6EHF3_IRIPA|nr:telomere repeat-binding protein 2-like isoform X1 [Iris pallida]
MVVKKRLDYGFNGYKVPPVHVPNSAKGKRSARKKKVDDRMCAIDLLAAVARKLLLEGEGSFGPSTGGPDPCNLKVKQEQDNAESQLRNEAFDLGSCTGSTLGSNNVSQREVSNVAKLLSTTLTPSPIITKSDTSSRNVCTEKPSLAVEKSDNFNYGTVVYKNDSDSCSLHNNMGLDAKPLAVVNSSSTVNTPLCGDGIICSRSFPKCRKGKLAVGRDDDENLSGCIQPNFTNNKALKPQGLGERRVRKQLATKFWKVAPTMTKDRELPKTDVETKPNFYRRKICYARQWTQRSVFKRRKFFQRCSILTSVGGSNNKVNRVSSSFNGRMPSYEPEDFHVKLSIKSFKVPELFIDIPETSTVASLKRTVMEAVTAILGGGLHIGVVVQGKKVRDDSKTLLQSGISHGEKLDDLGFTLEPNANRSLTTITNPEELHILPSCDLTKPLARLPAMVSAPDVVKLDVCTESPRTPIMNCQESNHDSVRSPADTFSLDKTGADARALIAISSMSVDTLPTSPARKPRQSELCQRRIRRPFSVTEVEALVQAVEKLGTGRWRDVKIRAFDNAKHRTYVDLKDKWKTLVHTASIAPQQRRGEPVPQELLDRVLTAHAYWSQQQAKFQVKSPA